MLNFLTQGCLFLWVVLIPCAVGLIKTLILQNYIVRCKMSSKTVETMKIKLEMTSGDYLFQPPIQSRVNFKLKLGFLGHCLFKF